MLAMWKSDEQTANSEQQTAGTRLRLYSVRCGKGQLPNTPRSTRPVLLFAVCCLLFTPACRRDMQDQPKMKPFRSSTFFADGLSTRAPIEGTVARGFLKTDTEFFTGKKTGKTPTNAAAGAETPAGPQPTGISAGPALVGTAAYPDDVEVFPIPITQEVVIRGKERYEIFCTACHGLTGNGDGMIVRRGFRRAASFNDWGLRQAPVGHYFDAITNGWGAMPSYAPQIPAQDRWAIIAYIRALQLSQQTEPLHPDAQGRAHSREAPATTASPTNSPAREGGHR
jgi:mono/diheme cytochrome c family protein